MKKIFSITAILVLLSFAFVVSSDAFFCQDDKQEVSGSQAPVHCCAQCCPSHNLVPTAGQAIVLNAFTQSKSFTLDNSVFQGKLLISRIERPPIA